MAVTREHPCLRLSLLPTPFYVRRVKEIPAELIQKLTAIGDSKEVLSITRTAEEISLVGQCVSEDDPEAKWRCIKIAGPMEFELTGVICDFVTPLKKAGCPVFAISTWNTDYVLVPIERVSDAVHALKGDGWFFDDSVAQLQ
ncbi:ACT domain-containing protein [Daedaleopsis nitida]|nr:ACT domain-containing protein [Daedaleopsis nitida]